MDPVAAVDTDSATTASGSIIAILKKKAPKKRAKRADIRHRDVGVGVERIHDSEYEEYEEDETALVGGTAKEMNTFLGKIQRLMEIIVLH